MTVRRLIGTGVLVTGLFTATSGPPLSAQHPVEAMEWMINVLRPSGQPVIPIFEGWYEKPDGTYDLCFGYFNLNTKEVLDIPLGPDNFIEPARLTGISRHTSWQYPRPRTSTADTSVSSP